MNSKGFSTLNQHKIEKFINELLVDKVKIIFGPQHAGIEPIYHCSVILEAGLKVYLKKIDPQQNISRWGLGKLYGRSLEKDTFPKRFKIPIGRLNTIWIEKKHNVEKTGDISVDEIRKLTSDFIIWLFTKVLKQKMENDLSQIIFQGVKNEIIIESIKEKTISGKKKSTNSGRNNVLEDAYKKLRNIKKSDASTLISKSELEKVNLHIVFGSSFKRTYYNDFAFTYNEIRGIQSTLNLKHLSVLNLQFDFLNSEITITNNSENLTIKIDNIALYRKRKRMIVNSSFTLSINEITLYCTLQKY